MIDVGRDDHAAGSNLATNYFRRQLLALGDEQHLLCNHLLTGVMHLRDVALRLRPPPLNPFLPRLGCPGGTVTILLSHGITLGNLQLYAPGTVPEWKHRKRRNPRGSLLQ